MKKHLLLFALVLIGQFIAPGIGRAAVTPVAGNVDPEVSTEDSPKWYTIMSSHLTVTDRQNRFLVWDGTRLKTEKFDSGIPEAQLEDKYLWRLEEGSANNKVYIVNKTGMRIYAPAGVSSTNNTELSVDESGVEWEMKLASATGLSSDCADKQYCFNFLGALTPPAYLNAMDAQGGDTDKAYGVTVFNAGVHQASGWFFYEANVQEVVKYTVTFNEPENGTIQVANAEGGNIDSNTKLVEGTEIDINITPAAHYEITSILINNEEQKENFIETDGVYSYATTVTEDLDIAVSFALLKYVVNVEINPIASGTLTLTNNKSEIVPSGTEVEYGTVLEGALTYEDTFIIKALDINGFDYMEDIVDDLFVFEVKEPTTISVEFETLPVGINTDFSTSVVIPGEFAGNLTVTNVNPGDCISLYDITGMLISSETAQSNRVTLNTESVGKGCYIVQIKQSGKTVAGKTIKR